jgi:hypothetical protein
MSKLGVIVQLSLFSRYFLVAAAAAAETPSPMAKD